MVVIEAAQALGSFACTAVEGRAGVINLGQGMSTVHSGVVKQFSIVIVTMEFATVIGIGR